MKMLNAAIEWVLYTSLFAACCAVGMCMATELLVIKYIPLLFTSLHFLVFGSTLLVYNVHHIVKRSAASRSDIFRWSLQYKGWHFFFSVLGVLMAGASLYRLSWKIWLGCVVLALLSFAYSLPLLPFTRRKRIRDFGWIKILVLTSVWTIVTSILPLLYWGEPLSDYPYEILLRFVFMFTLCVAFDVRDMQTDLDAGIHTLPNIIGLRNSYRLMNVSIAFFGLLSIIQYLRYPSVTRLVGELLTALATKWAIEYTKKHPTDKAYLGVVDGMMLLYAILVLIH
ncbi:MAG: UbiA family prenyltransferase [Taibaiella sp.]|nr:UbiA family prenyltransferase [Taibaiella sp.]